VPDDAITAWRITQSRYVEGDGAAAGRAAFGGEGARLYGGRWNGRGTPVAYAAASRSLALLEVLVHLGAPQLLARYVLIPVTFAPEHVEDLTDVPDDWRAHPAPRSTQEVGDAWVREARSPVLRVPSVVVPAEWNVVVNPRHPDFGELEIGAPETLDVDARLRAGDG
jgi:RES domain-containing protein